MNRVLDSRDHWHALYNEIRENQEIIDRVLRSPDAWMYQRKLEELAQLNVKYQKKLEEVGEALDSIGAGGFAVADMPTQNADANTAFCRKNRDPMRYQRWHDAWIREALPKAKQVSLKVPTRSPASPDEAAEWSKGEEAWATAPFLEGTAAMARFVIRYPNGPHAQEAREHIAAGIEMDWSTQVYLSLRTIQGNRKIAEECQRLATDDPGQRKSLLEKSRDLLEAARSAIDLLQAMGFAGDLKMKLPHEKSNLTEVVLFFREFRLPGKYSEWEERRLTEIFAAAKK